MCRHQDHIVLGFLAFRSGGELTTEGEASLAASLPPMSDMRDVATVLPCQLMLPAAKMNAPEEKLTKFSVSLVASALKVPC